MYTTLLNLKFSKHTKVITVVDDVLSITNDSNTIEAESRVNVDLQKNSNGTSEIQ